MTTERVLGFDLSSRKLAGVLLDPGTHPATVLFKAPPKLKHRPQVLEYFAGQLEGIFRIMEHNDKPLWVFVEHPLVGRAGAHATIVQAQVQGIVLGLALRYGAAGAYEVNVKTWKKAIVGNGNADKDKVAQWVRDHQPALAALAGDDQDLLDAACIALYGRQVIERSEL